MLTAINELDGKIMDVEDLNQEEEVTIEDLDTYEVEAPKEEPTINAVFEQCKTQFKVANKLPTSFEKSLMTINYCLVLLSQPKQADEFLGLNT
jgi:uncharacterized protein (DUF2344 family)